MIRANAFRFLPHPQIVAIDNDEKDLENIKTGLFRAGLPCLTFLYDKMEGLDLPEKWRPERIRLIFLDLNLGDIDSPGVSDTVGPISEVLEKLHGQNIGRPFTIVFWTTYSRLVHKVMKKLYARYPATPLPVSFTMLDKTLFLPNPDGEYENDLAEKIVSAISKDKVFMAMMAWEAEVEAAAGRTYDRLHGLVAIRQKKGTALKTSDMQDVLRNIAKEAWGKENAKENPGAAITGGLTPILQDHLDSITTNVHYAPIWSKALKGDWDKKLPDHVTQADLNSHCLVDLNCSDKTRRGIWLEFTDAALRRSAFWKYIFGATKKELIAEFINFNDNRKGRRICNSVKLGLMEFTAACDRANNKAPLLRYGLCARIPIDFEEHISWGVQGKKRQTKHDAIYRIETISIRGSDYILYLDYRYVISLPPFHELLTIDLVEPIFRVRNQVLTDITAKFASHTSRPGIYSFPS
jgi:hypothetical protein